MRPKNRSVLTKLAQFLIVLTAFSCQSLDAQTSPAALPNLKLSKAGDVFAIVVQPDGKMILGGQFTAVNGLPRTNIARLNPNGSVDLTWNPQVSSLGAVVTALVLSGTDLFIGGNDGVLKGTTLGNGELDDSWQPSSVRNVRSMALSGTNLFIGGQAGLVKLSTIGSGTVNTSWTPDPLNNGSFNFFINAVRVDGTNVFVGGKFTTIGGRELNSVAKLSAETGLADPDWDAGIEASLSGDPVTSLAISETNLFVGGSFLEIGGTNIAFAAKLMTTGSGALDPDWRPSPNGPVSALGVRSDHVYIAVLWPCGQCPFGRLFRASTTGAGTPDSSWRPTVGPDFFYVNMKTFVLTESSVLVGGQLTVINGEISMGIMKLDPVTGDRDPGFGAQVQVPGSVKAMARQEDGKIIIGGDFWFAGGLPRQNLARVNPDGTLDRTWAPKTDDLVNAVVLKGDDAFIGGRFTTVSGIQRHGVAKLATRGSDAVDLDWNASFNASLDNNGVFALAVEGTDLFVGGGFSSMGGAIRINLAKLSTGGNGAADPAWQQNVTSGVGVHALAVDGPHLFVGGQFKQVGSVMRTNLAKLSTTGSGTVDANWHPMTHIPGNSSAFVLSLLLDGTNLFVGGVFDNIGGQRRRGLAKLAVEGSGEVDPFWDPVGEPPPVSSIASFVSRSFSGDGHVWTAKEITNPQTFTLGLWFNTTSTNGGRMLGFGDNQTGLSTLYDRHLYLDEAGRVHFGVLTESSDQAVIRSGPGYNDGQWHQATATFSPTTGMKLYIDGDELPVDSDASVTNLLNYDGWWKLGWDNGWLADPTAAFTGLMADVRIWDRVRAAGEITNDFDRPLVGNEPGLASYWRLEGFTSSIPDATGGGNTGTASGSPVPRWAYTSFPRKNSSDYVFGRSSAFSLAGTNLYVGGVFSGLGGVARNNLAQVSTAGTGEVNASFDPGPEGRGDIDYTVVNSVVRSVLANGRDLYVAGGFTTLAGTERHALAFLPVADAPVLIQDTLSDLIITRNAEDGPEVTHFRIIGIADGPLFKADGVTPINVDDYITVAEGEAGLKFVPGGTVSLVSALNATPGGAGKAVSTLTMVSNLPPVLAFDKAAYSTREGEGNVVVVVRKYGNGVASVDYETTDITALGDIDYQSRAGTLTFSSTDSVKNLVITIADDLQTEGDEQFGVNLSNPGSGTRVAGSATALVTLEDNDGASFAGLVAAQLPVSAPPPAGGMLLVNLEPSEANGQWRLAGGFNWHDSGASVTGLVTGNYSIEFRQVSGYYPPSFSPLTVPISAGMTNSFRFSYAATPALQMGDLSVVIGPDEVATNANPALRGQWRRRGEAAWRDSGDKISDLVAGSYEVEFNDVPGRLTPPPQLVQVGANATYSTIGIYFFSSAPSGEPAAVVPFETATSTEPYLYNGQIQTEVGFGSGFVVKQRVVLTAAHVLFDDALIRYSTSARWFFQRYRDQLEPVPLVPRGWYVFNGYAAQREIDNSPGLSTPTSQNLDVAAMYFLEEAGRGGFGGYLSTDADDNEHLLSANNKFLAGYPLEGVDGQDQGKLFATAPANLKFTRLYTSIFATTNIQGLPGNSGGPLYVQTDIDEYLPAAIYLGGSGQTLVRAINSEVVDLIDRAEVSGNGGGNSTGGGVVAWSQGLTTDSFNPGLFAVIMSPPQAVEQGAGWRLVGQEDKTYISDPGLQLPLVAGAFDIEFNTVPGFVSPPTRRVEIVVGQTTTVEAEYTVFRITPNGTWSAADGFVFNIAGSIGSVYAIDASTNLSDWALLTTLTNLSGTLEVRDPAAAGLRQRFYRARELSP